jgi:hypothetical protein
MGIGAGGSVGEGGAAEVGGGERGGEGNGEGGEGGEGSEGGIASPHEQICVRLPVLLEQTDAQIDGGDGEGGGAEGGGAATTMIGADSTVIPSAVVAAVAVRRAAESVASTWVEVLEAGTAMVAVTITDAAVTAMLTACVVRA